MLTTCLVEEHTKLGAKFTSFAGWRMPLHYGSQINEHNAVRNTVGMFDVSHMHTLYIQGEDALDFLSYVLSNNANKLKIGRALYTCMLNQDAGIIDDLIIYKVGEEEYILIINASRLEADLTWLKQHARPWDVNISVLDNHGILAIQGPQAKASLIKVWPELETFLTTARHFDCLWQDQQLIAISGYTGENGVELVLEKEKIIALWRQLIHTKVPPCGLGARDTLRLEAGFNLYGQDMDEQTSPIEANLLWSVALSPPERNFIGRKALETNLNLHKIHLELKSLVLQDKGVCRAGQKIFAHDVEVGYLTSGGYSPTLKRGIGLARLPTGFEQVQVAIHGKKIAAKLYPSPLVKQGQANIFI